MVDCGPVAPIPEESQAASSPELAARLRREGGYLLSPAPIPSLAERTARRAQLARDLGAPVALHSVRHDGRPIWRVQPTESKGQQFIRECAEAGIPLTPAAARAALGFDDAWAELERRRLVEPITEEEPPVDPTTIGGLVSGVTGLAVAAGATMANRAANRAERARARTRDEAELAAEMQRQVAALQRAADRMKGAEAALRKAARPARTEAQVRAELDAAHARAAADRRGAGGAGPTANLARAREAEVAARRSVRRAVAKVADADDARRGTIRQAVVLTVIVLVLGLFVSPWLLVALLAVLGGAASRMGDCRARRRSAVLLREDAEEDHGLALALLLDLEGQHGEPRPAGRVRPCAYCQAEMDVPGARCTPTRCAYKAAEEWMP